MMHIVDVCILFNNIILYVMLLVIILVEVFSIREWTANVRDFLVENEINTLQLRTQTAADLASVKFLDMASDVSLIRNITQHIVNGSLAPTSTFVARNYFNAANYSDQGLTGGTSQYQDHSGWYNHATGNSPTHGGNQNLNMTALFRHPWQSVSDNWLAQGFGDYNGLTRFFPLGHNSGFPTRSYTCVSNDVRNNKVVTGYDPRCRGWYAAAELDTNSIIYSSPYEDALSGGWVITLSTAVMNVTASSTTLAGALFSDVSMVSLQIFFDGLDGDHTFLIDDLGNVVVHKIFENGATLQQRLFPFSIEDQQAFEQDQLKQMSSTTETSGQVSYVYNGRSYVGAYAKVKGTKYICGILIDQGPISDKTKVIEENGEGKIFIICYLISYFALYSMGMGSACCGFRPKTGGEGLLKIGLPLSFLFICLLAIALPLSFLANAGLVNDVDALLTVQTKETVRQLSINNGDWLTGYLQAAWYRNLQSLYHISSRSAILAADLQFGASFQDDTVNASLLSPPLVSDARLAESGSLVSMSSTSWFVTGTNAAAAASLSTTLRDQINTTQLMTQFFRSLYTTNSDFVLTYAGFSSKLFRKYPGSVSGDLTYDPTQRTWYSLAQNSSYKTDTTSKGYGYKGTVFTPPYKDAFSGEWMTTAARATPDSATVLGGDLLLATITDIFSNIKFFRTGRATLFDFEDNLVIADRDLRLTKSQANPHSYTEMETPPISSDLFAQMRSGATVGPEVVTGSDGIDYYIYSRKLTDPNLARYGIMTSVPVSEAREAVEPTLDTIRAASVSVGTWLGVTCFVVIIFILVSSTLAKGKPKSAESYEGEDMTNAATAPKEEEK